ncbi:hypothetical protein CFN78_28185 [Amycolatopsis antarctica]|uniref:Uncharacterized protein n=1 Tax=Amycolatopsis antarctica TaxID=1854586 RepID=A0A263CXT5_9PSEU|nr:hypothetical protein [Amycolatopsis antarctica]OZM69905.1 hypothetical protein CFN78_28185 [Amycolatopsis antarctica]
MSAFDVLSKFGTGALLKFAGAVVLFLVLHLLRIPVVVLARSIEVGMRRVDGHLAASVSNRNTKPHNDFFAHNTTRPTV